MGDVSRCDGDLFSKGLHFVTSSFEDEPRRATVPTSKEIPGGVAEQPRRALLLPLDHDLVFTLFNTRQVKEICIQNQEYNHSNSLPPITVRFHGVRNLLEARDVRADDQARQGFARITFLQAELSASLKGRPEDVLHDALEPAIDLLKRPGEPGGVLRHFETRDGDTAAVARLSRGVPDGLLNTLGTSGLEDVDRLLGAALDRRTIVSPYTVSWSDRADAPC